MRYLLIGHHRTDWQGDDFTVQGFRERQLQMAERLRVGLLMVRGDWVMDGGVHATRDRRAERRCLCAP